MKMKKKRVHQHKGYWIYCRTPVISNFLYYIDDIAFLDGFGTVQEAVDEIDKRTQW